MTQALETSPASRSRGAADLVPARLDDLTLVRIATLRGAATPAALARELRPLAPSLFNDARWFGAIEQSLSRLRGARQVDARGRATSPATAMKRLGLRVGTPWRTVYNQTLPGLGLAIAAADARAYQRLTDHDAWAGAVVARFRGIWREGPPPSWTVVADTVVWQALRLAGKPKRTPPEIRSHFLRQALGHAAAPPARVLHYLAAHEVSAVRPDLRSLREALARRWLEGAEARAQAPSAPPNPLAEFAGAVRDAAAHAVVGVFGRHKVFIAPLWRTLRIHPAVAGMSLEDFKRQLVAANRAGLLSLARADLVAAMDPRDVAESEVRHLEARYHFVDREETP
jgi:hypothetical protein